ncbi:MAG: hypothetical protein H5U00_07465 [Clostridia bacterium]|nr:hypothetical protein [Clostridia bacterium]
MYPMETERDLLLAREGWVRKFATEAAKAGEYARLYEELGFEVRLEPLDPEVADNQCRACLVENCQRHVVIYTRPRS